MFPERIGNLILGELFPGEIALHILLAGLGNRLHQSLSCDAKVLLGVFRNLTFNIIAQFGKPASCHLYDVDVAYELLILTDRQLERRNLSAEFFLQLQYQLTVAGMVIIHIRHENQARQVQLLTQFPRFFRTNLDACLTVYNDDSCIGYADSLLNFTHEIKISWGIQ